MISEQLEFDISAAEQAVNTLDQALSAVTQSFAVSLADALAILQAPLTVEVTADTTAATTEIDTLAQAAPVDIPVDADTTAAQTSIDAIPNDIPPVDIGVSADIAAALATLDTLAASVPDETVQVDADVSGAAASLATLQDQPPVDLSVDAATGDAEAAIQAVEDQPPVQLEVEADTSNAESDIQAVEDQPPVVLDVEADTTSANADIQQLEDIPPVEVAVTADTTDATAAIDNLQDQPPIELQLLAVTDEADAALAAVHDQPPIDIPVEADTSAAEALLAALAEQPPIIVGVDADTTEAAAAIEEVAANPPTVDIPVEADTSGAQSDIQALGDSAAGAGGGVDNLTASISGLTAGAGIAGGSASGLSGVLKSLGPEGAAAATGVAALTGVTTEFFQAGLTAVSAGQNFNQILGDMSDRARHVDVLGLNTSMEQLGTTFGSTGADMETASAKLFQFAINSGVSKTQALTFTQQIEALSARAISLNPNLGTLSDVMDSLGIRISRGGRFAAQYGLDLSTAEISTRALADTGKSSASELSFMEKAIAGAEIAAEKYGGTLAGTVAVGSQNAQVQLEALSASFKDAIEQIGAPLVAPIFDLIRAVEPVAIDFAKVLGSLATDVIPVLTAELSALEPELQAIADVFNVINPVLDTVFGLFSDLPQPVQEVIGAVLSLQAPFIIVEEIVKGVIALFENFGPSLSQVTDAIAAVADFIGTAVGGALSLIEGLIGDVVGVVSTGVGLAQDALSPLESVGSDVVSALQAVLGVLQPVLDFAGRVAEALVTVFQKAEELAHTFGGLGIATGSASDQFAQFAGKAGESVNLFGAINGVLDDMAGKTTTATKTQQDLQTALQTVLSTNTDLAASYQAVATGTGDSSAALADLAVSMQAAGIQGQDLDTVAKSLGVSSQALQGFIKQVTGEIDNFASTAIKQLPTVSSAIDETLDPTKHPKPTVIDIKALQQNLTDSINAITGFNENMTFLISHGFDDIAKEAAQKGPEFTAAIVKAIQNDPNGNLGTALDEQFAALNRSTSAEGPLLQQAGGAIVVGSGDVADAASAAFGSRFQLVAPTQEQLTQAGLVAELAHVPFSTALQQVAGDGVTAFGSALQGVPGQVSNTFTTATGAVVTTGAPALQGAGTTAGGALTTGVTTGAAGTPAAAQGILNDTATALSLALPGMIAVSEYIGGQVGLAFDLGLTFGLGSNSNIPADITGSLSGALPQAIAVAEYVGGVVGQSLDLGIEAGIRANQHVVFDDTSAAMIQAIGGLIQIAETTGQFIGKGIDTGIDIGIKQDAHVVFDDGAQAMIQAVGPLVQVAISIGTSVGQAYDAGVGEGVSGSGGIIFNDGAQALISAAGGLITLAVQEGAFVGEALSDGLAQGIRDHQNNAVNAAVDVVNAAAAAARNAAQSNSPSKLFAKIGSDMSAGLALGMHDETDIVNLAAAQLVSDTFDETSRNAQSEAVKLGRSLADGIGTGLSDPGLLDVHAKQFVDGLGGAAQKWLAEGKDFNLLKTLQGQSNTVAAAAGVVSFRDVNVTVQAAPGMTATQAAAIGSQVGAAVVDRITPAAARRLTVSTRMVT